jgi:hypothetical protein
VDISRHGQTPVDVKLAETEGFEYTHFSVGISDFQRSTHVRTHEVVYES